MTNNKNFWSRKLIKDWYERSIIEEYNLEKPFDKFIYPWISFNCFFVSELYSEADKLKGGRREPSENNYLQAFARHNQYKKIYSRLLKTQGFKEEVSNLKMLLDTITHFSGKVANLRHNPPLEGEAKPLDKIDNFEQLIFVIYQIRCNLFHGNKSPYSDGDIDLVSCSFKILSRLLNKVYCLEGYIIQ